MNKSVPLPFDQFKSNLNEINNNLDWRRRKNDSQVSFSSASSYQSDSSEEISKLERKDSLQDVIDEAEDMKLFTECARARSMSDGAAVRTADDRPFEVFPSLPDVVLEKMGLHGNNTRERFNEEELEQMFTTLALAFAIDSSTIKDRCQRQKRYRDQTEVNLSKEIDKFKEKLSLMHPLCTDFEKAELLSTLFSQIDVIEKATHSVSWEAERYGSIQQEDRLAESVQLMINHVQMLKQQRDSARRQLQYTKKVLQNAPESPSSSPTIYSKYSPSIFLPNRKIVCRRRASIASISQQLPECTPLPDMKKLSRRTSDLSLRASSLTRNGRLSRLELGGELLKIKEVFTEPVDQKLQETDSDSELQDRSPIAKAAFEENNELNLHNLSVRHKFRYKLKSAKDVFEEKYQTWSENGTMHEFCCFCALLCFSFSLLLMINILVEYEYAKRGIRSPQFLWNMFRTSDGT